MALKFKPAQWTRRRFLKGLATGAVVTAFSPWLACEAGTVNPGTIASHGRYGVPTLSGPEFDLAIEPTAVNITGTPRIATLVNGLLPGPGLHWHGILVPNDMDGVPEITFRGIAPGTTFTYRFLVRRSGTFSEGGAR